ncbi:MAG: NAD(P)H-dependent oxidoreductase [Bacteroidia bacterium]|jgi:chromate reductase|tara:strand:+ start:2340 stop:2909 length:570 start_codon:yes stop_codon:yes gene_type:complete
MKIGIISGSARKGNNTHRVALAIKKQLGLGEIVDFQDYDLPNFAEGWVNPSSETAFQQHLIKTIDDADLLIVLTPEYNWFPSAEIINSIHQLAGPTYKHIFDNKVVTTLGVSTGRGGRMPAVQLGYVFNKIFNVFDLNSITSPRTFEAQEVLKCIDDDGNLLDNEMFNKGFKDYLDYSMKVAKRWQVSE